MLKTLSLKKGFTLIEILIVVSIIAVLAVLSVSGYTAFRKAALIDLSADALVAQINEMRDKTIHGTKIEIEESSGGDTEKEEFLKCYGLRLNKKEDSSSYVMTAAVYKFTNQKVWDSLSGEWVYQGCDTNLLDDAIFEMDSMVNVEKITEVSDGDEGVEFLDEEFVFRFAPPSGNVEVSKGLNFESGKNLIKIKIRYGAGDDDRYSRVVVVDLSTGSVIKEIQ